MFWKKAPTPSEKEPPPVSAAPTASDDAALDTVASLLKAFGEHAFDTDNVTALETRAECDGWAKRITVGEGKTGEDGERKAFRRDYAGVRRFFTAQRTHERWSMDFVHDQLFEGRAFRVLTVVDQFSRQTPLLEPRFSFSGRDVVAALDRAIERAGTPISIFIASTTPSR